MGFFQNIIHKIEHTGGQVVHEVQHEFHAVEDHVKSEAVQKAIHKCLTELKSISQTAGNAIPDVELDLAFVDISVTGLGIKNDTTGKLGIERIIEHFTYWSNNFHWNRNDVHHMICDLYGWEPVSFDLAITIREEAAVPILGDVGLQETWYASQLVEIIDELCEKVGL